MGEVESLRAQLEAAREELKQLGVAFDKVTASRRAAWEEAESWGNSYKEADEEAAVARIALAASQAQVARLKDAAVLAKWILSVIYEADADSVTLNAGLVQKAGEALDSIRAALAPAVHHPACGAKDGLPCVCSATPAVVPTGPEVQQGEGEHIDLDRLLTAPTQPFTDEQIAAAIQKGREARELAERWRTAPAEKPAGGET